MANILSLRTCQRIIEGDGQKYRRVERAAAVQMDQEFQVEGCDKAGVAGDYLVLDPGETPKVVEQAAFVQRYQSVSRMKVGL